MYWSGTVALYEIEMFRFLEKCSAIVLMGVIFVALASEYSNAEVLKETGRVEIAIEGKVFTYFTVSVKSNSHTYRSSEFIKNEPSGEFSITITAYENPKINNDLDSIDPMADGPSITLYAYIDAEGQETRGAEIALDLDPAGRFYLTSDAMSDDVTLTLDSFDLDPEAGYFKGAFSGRVCHLSLPDIKRDKDKCKDVTIKVASDLSKND